MNFIGIPLKISLTKRCDRCGLQFRKDQDKCPHCDHLSDSEVNALKSDIKAQEIANTKLGYLFLLIFIIAVVFMALFIMY